MVFRAYVTIRHPLDRAPWEVPDLIAEITTDAEVEVDLLERLVESRGGVQPTQIAEFLDIILDGGEWITRGGLSAVGTTIVTAMVRGVRRWVAKRRSDESPRKVRFLLGPDGDVIASVESPSLDTDNSRD